ncbi:MAG: DUF1460 domain-containing protein [Paludibacteraceae bacterium]|nr:DUF1460 domain-containing protein [Paludibacteraceae bacterium]
MAKHTFYKIAIALNILLLAVSNAHAQVDITKVPNYKSLEDMIEYAKTLERRPYRTGATGPYAFDCSGFTQHCFNQIGLTLNRTSAQQAEQGKKIRRQKRLKAGDLVCFNGSKIGKDVGHVGIVVENNDGVFTFIHASSSVGITISKSDVKYYDDRYLYGRRITDNKRIRRAIKKFSESSSAETDVKEQEEKRQEKKEPSDKKRTNDSKKKQTSNEQTKKATDNTKRDAKETVENAFKNNTNKADTTKVNPTVTDSATVVKDTTKNEPAKPTDTNTFSGNTHKVEKGDTLYNIARRAGCTVQQLKDWNNLTSDALSIGQELRVK